MYLAPVSGPRSLREEGSRAGLERPFGQPGRASEHARTAAPFTGATAQKMFDVVASGTSAERLSPLGREPGRKSLKNRRATGTTTATATTPRSGVSVRSRLDLSSALQPAHRPTARSARERGGCGDRSRAL